MASSDSAAKVETGFWTLGAGELREFERKIGRRFSAEDVRAVDDDAVLAMHMALAAHIGQRRGEARARFLTRDNTPGPDNVFAMRFPKRDPFEMLPLSIFSKGRVNLPCRQGRQPGKKVFWLARLPELVDDTNKAIVRWARGLSYRPATCLEVSEFIPRFRASLDKHQGLPFQTGNAPCDFASQFDARGGVYPWCCFWTACPCGEAGPWLLHPNHCQEHTDDKRRPGQYLLLVKI